MLLDQKIVGLAEALEEAGIPYAYGGANALAFYAVPRATLDIDINIFLPVTEAESVLQLLGSLGASVDIPDLLASATDAEQIRVLWETTPVDLFFSYDPLHESAMNRRRLVTFAGVKVFVLTAEDLMIFKATFNRSKDWRDISEIIFATDEGLDFDYVRRWVKKIDDETGNRVKQLEGLIASGGRDLAP